ncbi:phosphate acyltransferase PlsX [Campylobacter geochelonis]|uniref:Phosphate acyltransferase n=1 Tax=Campylobacter geochelonis TaxID=1780362 RepID=A0A128ECR1_9BACT|nr:phosphate acyltransferase PlsX [Campylobacter geochelonis]QKF70638.1 acyl phosphate synthase [Campylobacter geochelonis]CZE45884.1 putative glycerol-3-phosphate acyltransferase PlsX [Campylobacter geochelonis]CZE46755.1 putative glycerol-3-phosphate acyltransferase PlsX [Campylobacter geochelonis]CZE50320.1 putative glycerol-3-phosphate acyltransferase PlsX [Campylobacter geochelonis]
MTKIAIDAMGGDFGCEPIVAGVIEALKERKFHAFLVGDEKLVRPLVPKEFGEFVTYVQADEIFEMKEGATDALKKKESSIYKAIELVRNKECNAVVSAGHSGATMSLATLRIGRLKNVIRPAIATLMPNSQDKRTLVLDVGANVDCKAEHLFQFAIMGEAYAKAIMGIEKPRLSILSNGEEDSKGDEVTKEARNLLKNLKNFVGNAEGSNIFDGSVDVVTCDGFMGNIVLKTAEGVAGAMNKLIKKEVKKSPVAIAGAVLMNKVFKIVKKSTDYDEYGGAPLLGIKDCVIISHGKSTPKAVKNAIFQALKFSNSTIDKMIEDELAKFTDIKNKAKL